MYMSRLAFTRSRGTVGDLFSGRNNGVGAIRLLLATAVVVSHSRPLGFGQHDVGFMITGQQTNLGTMAVYGFFVLSGLLITRSAKRVSLIRYTWHRGLRIFPALWICLLVTALVVAPFVAIHEHGSLAGFWTNPLAHGGPLAYVRANFWTGVRQYGIHDLFTHTTPWGRHTGMSVFDGALWSLAYEMLCYVAIGVLAVTGVLGRARRFVLVLTGVLYLRILLDYAHSAGVSGPANAQPGNYVLPLVGYVSKHWMTYLAFLFLVGAVVELYREYVPVSDFLGVLSGVVLVVTLLFGGFFVLGLPAFAYFLIWLSIRMPRQLHWIGRKNDYSYGMYIYGFVVQQVLVSLGGNRWGFIPFVSISIAITAVIAWLSWHLVERHALRLKNWTPPLPANWLPVRRPVAAGVGTVGAIADVPPSATGGEDRRVATTGQAVRTGEQPDSTVPLSTVPSARRDTAEAVDHDPFARVPDVGDPGATDAGTAHNGSEPRITSRP